MSVILTITMVFTLCSNLAFANTNSYLENLQSFNDEEAIMGYLNNLSKQELIQAMEEVANKLNELNADDEMGIFARVIAQKDSGYFDETEFVSFLTDNSYSDRFKIFMMDTYSYHNTTEEKSNSEEINQILASIISDVNSGEKLRSSALFTIDDMSYINTEVLKNIVEGIDSASLKKVALSFLSKTDLPYANLKVEEILSTPVLYSEEELCLAINLSSDWGNVETETLEAILSSQVSDMSKLTAVISLENIGGETAMKAILQNRDNINDDKFIANVFEKNIDSVEGLLTKLNLQERNKLLIDVIELVPMDKLNAEVQTMVESLEPEQSPDNLYKNNKALTAVDYTGMACYRDGVLIKLEWHAGVFVKADENYLNPIVHQLDDPAGPAYCTKDEFIGSDNVFMGVYKPSGISSATLQNIKSVAVQLSGRAIGYTAYYLLEHNATGTDIGVSNITKIRCDGLVEYCYEKNNIKLQASEDHLGNYYWNISKTSDAMQHNIQYLMSPKAQAAIMIRVD